MAQDYKTLTLEDYVDEGITDIQNRDKATATLFSGDSEPSAKFDNCVWNDTKNNALKRWIASTSTWETILDYGKTYIFSVLVDSGYQPLASALTDYASVSVETCPGMIGDKWYPLSQFWLTSLQTSTSISDSLNFGKLSSKDIIISNDIDSGAITKAKLADGILTDPVFQVGDTVPSFAQGTKKGFLKMSTSSATIYTVGNSASRATYKSANYQELFALLWNRGDCVLYTSNGASSSRGSSASADWSANKRIQLPHIDLPSDEVETQQYSAASGGSWSYTITRAGWYEVKMTGGGGGGASMLSSTGPHGGYGQGSSGAGFDGVIKLAAGDVLSANIGGGGKALPLMNSASGWHWADTGGTSTFYVNGTLAVTCTGGGGAGVAWWKSKGQHWQNGDPGTCTINTSSLFVSSTGYTGNKGSGGQEGSIGYCNAPVGGLYGAGGGASRNREQGSTTDGRSGYINLSFVSPAEYHSTDSSVKSALDTIYKSLTFHIKY